jgi:hypothetical protein
MFASEIEKKKHFGSGEVMYFQVLYEQIAAARLLHTFQRSECSRSISFFRATTAGPKLVLAI